MPAVFERPSYVRRWRRTGWLGISDSNSGIRAPAMYLRSRDKLPLSRAEPATRDYRARIAAGIVARALFHRSASRRSLFCRSKVTGMSPHLATASRVDNSLGQSDRSEDAIAPTVPLGSFDTLPAAGTRRRGGERDGLGVRQRTCASGRWAPLELHVSRAEVDDAEPDCARIALDAPTRVLSRWRRHCDPGLRAACAS